MDKLSIQKREGELLDALKISSRLSVEDAVGILDVSESTVRRVFSRLEEKGQIIRVYGGISLVAQNENNYAYERLEIQKVEEKSKIGITAAETVCDNDVIYLDAGTTLSHMALALAKRIESGDVCNIKIYTSSLVNFNILQKLTPVILIGGEYRPSRRDFHGYIAEETLKYLHFGKCFLGADGFDVKAGLTATDFTTARMTKLALEHSSKSFVLCDSGKYRRISVISYAEITEINCLITDFLPDEGIKQFEETGVSVKLPV